MGGTEVKLDTWARKWNMQGMGVISVPVQVPGWQPCTCLHSNTYRDS